MPTAARSNSTKKKRNPQDATLRNIRALKTRVRTLERTVRLLIGADASLRVRVGRLEDRMSSTAGLVPVVVSGMILGHKGR